MPATSHTIDECMARLAVITKLSFTAASSAGTGWSGRGEGEVRVTRVGEDALRFDERGTWTPAQGKPTTFTNVYRWTRGDDALRLEHLRFGVDRPVFLFALAPTNTHEWRSVLPHVCSEDCYSGELTIAPNEIRLRWTVRGPKKDEDIRYVYAE